MKRNIYCNVRLSPSVRGFVPPIRVCDPMGPAHYTSPWVERLTHATEVLILLIFINFVLNFKFSILH